MTYRPSTELLARIRKRTPMAVAAVDAWIATRYSEDQPRDELGRFGEGGGGGGPGSGRDLTATGRSVADHVARQAALHEDPKTGVGPRGDERLRAIAERQGFDGQPTVVSKDEMDRLVAEGNVELFRGVADHVESGQTGAELAEQFRSGDLHYGNGTFGNGTYTTTSERAADEYALHGWRNETSSGQYGETMRMTLSPDARVVDYDELQAEHAQYLDGISAEYNAPDASAFGGDDLAFLASSWQNLSSSGYAEDARVIAYGDIGRYAAARGYDAVRIPAGAVAGGEGHYQYDILNRTAVVVQR